jgi:hypothetical protein
MSNWLWTITACVALAISFFGGMIVIAVVPSATKAEMRLCDKAVSVVLNSTDPVELQRAGIIIRNVHCGIILRLTDAGDFKPRIIRGAFLCL